MPLLSLSLSELLAQSNSSELHSARRENHDALHWRSRHYFGYSREMAAKPLITPQPYNGSTNWTDWSDRFESIAEINDWDAAAKKKWVRVSLTGRAATAYKRLPDDTRGDFGQTMKALKKRFEPESKQSLYMAELNSKKKRTSEDWAAFGEDLRVLAEKAYPDLEPAAQERLALNQFLDRIDDGQLAFAVRQKQPKTVDDAVQATLKLQSYLPTTKVTPPQDIVAGLTAEESDEDELTDVIAAAPAGRTDRFGQLLDRLDRMETDIKSLKKQSGQQRDGDYRRQKSASTQGPIVCLKCGREGHFARGCAARRTEHQGNERPSQQ